MNSIAAVATLIANPANANLSPAIVSAVNALLPDSGAVDWLAEAVAADIFFRLPSLQDRTPLQDKIRDSVADNKIDVILQPSAKRRKKLFLADMDSTIIGQECIDELADSIGIKDHVAAITERAMRGEIEFEPALRERVSLLQGLDATITDTVIAERITLNPGARTLVQTMRANGVHTLLVSGGFTLFTKQIAAKTGFHENRANQLIIEDGKLSGSVLEPILGRQAKLEALLEFRSKLELTEADTLAIGDGANDLAMLEQAGLGIAYYAKPAVAAAAHARIDNSDLTALLYAQGYSQSEFVLD